MASLRDKVMAARSSTPARLLPLWKQWRLAAGDHVFSDGALELAAHVLKRRQATFPHMRNSPSAGATCERASVISFLGHRSPPNEDADAQHIFDNGNFIHLKWQMYLYDMGVLVAAEVPLAVPKWGAVGTCDGIVKLPTGDWYKPTMTREDLECAFFVEKLPHWTGVLEIKGWNPYKWKSVKAAGQPDDRTRWQGDLYSIGAQHTMPLMEVEGTCYWLENKENSQIIEYDLACTPEAESRMDTYYEGVLGHVDAGTLPARPHTPDSFACRYCPVRTHCERLEAKQKTTIAPAKGATRGTFEGQPI